MSTIRVILADDHPIVRNGIRRLLEIEGTVEIVGEAANGIEAMQLVEQLNPDVLVLDMEMPGMSGIEVTGRLRDAGSSVRILVLSAYDDDLYIFSALESGAMGYLTKEEALTRIGEAVCGVALGEEGWFSREVTAKVMMRRPLGRQAAARHTGTLSSREMDVVMLLAQGLMNHAIATRLNISDATVKNHVIAIYDKLNVHTRAEAVAWAWKSGILRHAPPIEE